MLDLHARCNRSKSITLHNRLIQIVNQALRNENSSLLPQHGLAMGDFKSTVLF